VGANAGGHFELGKNFTLAEMGKNRKKGRKTKERCILERKAVCAKKVAYAPAQKRRVTEQG